MKRIPLGLFFACLAAGCALLAATVLFTIGGGGGAPDLVVVSTGNTCGVFEPCRCPTNPYGGVARRVTLISEERKKHPDLLLVDSGNVFDPELSGPRAELLTWAYRLASYDAVAVGALDVMRARKLGAKDFKAMGIPWVCSNMESGREELGIEKYRILTRSGKKVAVLAFLGTRLVNRDVLREGTPTIALSNPETEIAALMRELRPQVDLVCVLAHMPRAQAEQLFNRTSGIDFLVMGHDKSLKLPDDLKPQQRVFVEVGMLGQYLTVSEFGLTTNAVHGRPAWTTRHVCIEEKVANHPDLWKRYEALGKGEKVEPVKTALSAEFDRHMQGGSKDVDGKPRIPTAVFMTEGCSSCEVIQPGNLAKLSRKLGLQIDAKFFHLDRGSDYELLVQLEKRYGKQGNELPVVFLGTHVLGGEKEIEGGLADAAKEYAQSGKTVEAPAGQALEPPSATIAIAHPISMAYFDEPGCPECRRVKYALKRLTGLYPELTVRTFDVSDVDNRVLQEAIGEKLGVTKEKRLLTPAIFVGQDALIKERVTDGALEQLIVKYASDGASPVWDLDLDLAMARQRLRERFASFGLAVIVLGGLADGVNPCAFATLILFVSFLTSAAASRSKILLTGSAFAAGVFTAYLLTGLGLTQAVRWLESVPFIRSVVTYGILGLCGLLAVLSIRDAFKAARGKLTEMTLQLPKGLKAVIRSLMIRFGRASNLALAGFVVGLLVSMVELACTGQVYLPIIKLMVASAGGQQVKAFFLLLLYNLCFILPLLVVLAAVYWGATSQRLTALLREHAVAAKAALAGVFALMFALLLVLSIIGSPL